MEPQYSKLNHNTRNQTPILEVKLQYSKSNYITRNQTTTILFELIDPNEFTAEFDQTFQH